MDGTALPQTLLNAGEEGELSNYIFGIYSYGKDCGFGNEMRFTKLSSYADWIDYVIYNTDTPEEEVRASKLKNSNNYNDRIVFIDKDEDDSFRALFSIGLSGL